MALTLALDIRNQVAMTDDPMDPLEDPLEDLDPVEDSLDNDMLDPYSEDSMDYVQGMEEEDEASDYAATLLEQFNNNNLKSTWKVMSEHGAYLTSFLKAHTLLIKGNGPLPPPVRHFVAIMAAGRHSCASLVANHRSELLAAGGEGAWLEEGVKAATTKVQRLGEINKILAHQPWRLTPKHIQDITRPGVAGNWSLSELVYAIVLMAHFHSFSSFIESCVSMEDESMKKSANKCDKSANSRSPLDSTQQKGGTDSTRPYDCSSQPASPLGSEPRQRINSVKKMKLVPQSSPSPPPYDCSQPKEVEITALAAEKSVGASSPGARSGASPPADKVDALIQRMKVLRSRPEPNQDELAARFDKVERTSAEIGRAEKSTTTTNDDIRKYLVDPDYKYVDFAQREHKQQFPTARVQDYNWEDEGFNLISRFYDDIAQLLDDKFKLSYNLTYGTMGRLTEVDTSMFRRATWNYIQCLYGIRYDDYDYAEVNDLLHRSLKKYIKTAACYPDRCVLDEYKNIMTDFQPSEKIHVCLLVAEAKFQSELMYALRAVATHFKS